MKELVKITETNGKKAVSARELYEALGFESKHWSRWHKKNITENQFSLENEDWQGFPLMVNGNETQDFALSIDFAKKLSMLARTEAGEKIRQYFIEVEKKALAPKELSRKEIAYMLIEAEEEKERLQLTIHEQQPKVLFADSVATSDDDILISELAKILKQNGIEIGQNRLFEWLRQNHYLGRKGDYYNKPTQKAMDLGLFKIKETVINKPDGTILITSTSKVTGKGQLYFINKFLKKAA